MANSLCSTPLTSIKIPSQPGLIAGNSTARKVIWISDTTRNCKTVKLQSLQAKAADGDKSTTKINSILCADCDGNGALLCPECQGAGVNPEDKRNGQFKAGGLCWLCRGKRDILCGNCNGAGFMGGFMSTFDS
ncbi:hypothetical protein RHSIM_Rhsim01G0071100 [Rhododendron simsii]|uniref:BSD2 cysteine rich domain-containing protein n=1 Tax=Rhododendron simsii TaxID=118357 RepID=A0A834HI43_RHOSS|nr:hypothetical protein RHSIM_Rhsim01G0071100 [Rhododendron simsii]